MKKHKTTILGITALITANFLYGFWGILSRFISKDFGVFSQYAFRSGFVTFVTLLVLISKKQRIHTKKADIPWLIVWILTGIITDISIYLAFIHTQIGLSYFLFICSMALTGIGVGVVLYHEQLTKKKIAAIALSLAGLYFIFLRDIYLLLSLWLFMAVFAGISSGIWNTIPKKFSGQYSKLQLLFLGSVTSFIIYVISAIFLKQYLPAVALSPSWVALSFVSLTQLITTPLILYGFKHIKAHIGSLIMPFEIVFGTVLAFLVFGETLPVTTIFGGFLVIIASVLSQD